MKMKLTIAAASLMLSSLVLAQPSVYFLYKQTGTGRTVCNPQAPGAGWTQVAGPFEDANCKMPAPQ